MYDDMVLVEEHLTVPAAFARCQLNYHHVLYNEWNDIW